MHVALLINNKIDELQLYIEHKKPDIVRITETWLNEDILNSELNISD